MPLDILLALNTSRELESHPDTQLAMVKYALSATSHQVHYH